MVADPMVGKPQARSGTDPQVSPGRSRCPDMPMNFPAPFPSSSMLNLHFYTLSSISPVHAAGDFPECHQFSTYIFMVLMMLIKRSSIAIVKQSPHLSAFLLDSRNSSKSSVTNFLCCAAFPSSPSFEHNNIFALHSLTDHSKASITMSWVL